jgi:hypothetical protein
MLRSSLLVAISAAAAIAGIGPASAQVAIEFYAGPQPYYDGYVVRRAPRAYGYYGEPGVVVRAPAPRGRCGEYRYWNGERCADARDTPPYLD